jgi:hypothetical protein
VPDVDLDDTFRALCALNLGVGADLFGYVGLDRRQNLHVIYTGDGRRRHGHVIDGADAYYWTEGFALAQGDPAVIRKILAAGRKPAPRMMATDEAAQHIPSVDQHGNRRSTAIGLPGIEYMVRTGKLYPVYASDGRRWFFADQIAAFAAARSALALHRDARLLDVAPARRRAVTAQTRADRAAAAWAAIEQLLPPAIPLAGVVGPAFPPAKPTNRAAAKIRLETMATGTDLGWFTFLSPDRGDYQVRVPVADGAPLRRAVPAARVMAWVRGFACWHRKDRLIDVATLGL